MSVSKGVITKLFWIGVGAVGFILLGWLIGALTSDAADSTMVINCRGVPDKWVMTCLDRDALYGANEWGEWTVITPAESCECPEGSRKKYGITINASDPPSQWVECWTRKTVCDTVWTKEE